MSRIREQPRQHLGANSVRRLPCEAEPVADVLGMHVNRLCGSTAIVTNPDLPTLLVTATSRPRTDEKTQGGQRYYEQGKPLSSHSPNGAGRAAGH